MNRNYQTNVNRDRDRVRLSDLDRRILRIAQGEKNRVRQDRVRRRRDDFMGAGQ